MSGEQQGLHDAPSPVQVSMKHGFFLHLSCFTAVSICSDRWQLAVRLLRRADAQPRGGGGGGDTGLCAAVSSLWSFMAPLNCGSLNPQGGLLHCCFDMQILFFAVHLAPPFLQPAACKNLGITKHCGEHL